MPGKNISMNTDANFAIANSDKTGKLQLLIIGRLFVLFLLLVAGWIWNSGELRLTTENFPSGLLLVFTIFVGLTILYFFIARINDNYDLQARIQFVMDAFLITWLVWRTGDLSSPYIPLYILLIAVSSIYLKARGTIIISVLCIILFILLTISTVSLFIKSFGESPSMLKVIQIVSFNIAAFLVVGLLAARLADRRASAAKLLQAERSLLNLRVLHERIIASIRSGLITTDLAGNIYTFNAAAREITGFSEEEMIGKSVFKFFGDVEQKVVPSLERTETGEQPMRFQTDIVTPEGFQVHIGYTISPLYSESNETSGLIITFQDLTEIRSMEEIIRRKDRLAAVGRVAAGLAHEIRNPLGAMRGAIQVLQMQMPPDSAESSLMEIILRESDRLNKIITNFLTYARPRAGNYSEVDIRESISDTFTLLRHSPDVKESHRLIYNLPDTPVRISADVTQLKQIFWNLARNSLQAMPDGGTLTVDLTKPFNNRIRIVFSDTGCGMPPEQVEQLFEPFSNSTTGGTGLGLSIVYQIIRDHNGTINVRSLENDGTTITIELPVKDAEKIGLETVEEPVGETYGSSKLSDFLTIKSEDNRAEH